MRLGGEDAAVRASSGRLAPAKTRPAQHQRAAPPRPSARSRPPSARTAVRVDLQGGAELRVGEEAVRGQVGVAGSGQVAQHLSRTRLGPGRVQGVTALSGGPGRRSGSPRPPSPAGPSTRWPAPPGRRGWPGVPGRLRGGRVIDPADDQGGGVRARRGRAVALLKEERRRRDGRDGELLEQTSPASPGQGGERHPGQPPAGETNRVVVPGGTARRTASQCAASANARAALACLSLAARPHPGREARRPRRRRSGPPRRARPGPGRRRASRRRRRSATCASCPGRPVLPGPAGSPGSGSRRPGRRRAGGLCGGRRAWS